MDASFNGRKVNEIWLPGDGNAENTRIKTEERRELVAEYSYQGDHADVWIVAKTDGIETERYNARQITTIVWS